MDALRAAWNAFHEGSAPEGVRPSILHSWRRCRELAVSPDLRVARWSGRRDRDDGAAEAFEAVGGEVVRRLADEIAGSRCVVALADASGTVLTRAGDGDVTRRTDAAAMVPGATWTEGAAGTNGFGLALALGRPVQVLAAEHYCAGWHDYGCTAAPIRHPATTRLLGAIDLTTPARVHNGPVVAALVRRAAAEAEALLAQRLVGPASQPTGLHDLERDAILRAVDAAGGNVTVAADALGISRATVYRRLRSYRLLGLL